MHHLMQDDMKKIYCKKLDKIGYVSLEDWCNLIYCIEDSVIVHFDNDVLLLGLEDIVSAECCYELNF